MTLLSLQNVCYYDIVSILSFRSHINPDQVLRKKKGKDKRNTEFKPKDEFDPAYEASGSMKDKY